MVATKEIVNNKVKKDGEPQETSTTDEVEKEYTKYSVTKVWEDDNNRDNRRPDSVSVQLYANGTAKGNPVVLNNSNNWKYTWDKLVKMNNGTEISYTVDEPEVPTYYTKTVNGNTITNKHTPEVIRIPVTKVWEDNDNYFNARKSVTVDIKVGNEVKDTITISASDNWTKTSKDLLKYENGSEIQYTVSERDVEGYELKGITGNQTSGFVITNTYENITINRMVYTSTDITTKEAKVDVVFVLDISGSMDDGKNQRAKKAVSAINKAMKSIFEKNSQNRVGIVVYSSEREYWETEARPNGQTLLELASYKPKSGNNYLTFEEVKGSDNDKISTNVNKVNANGSTTSVTTKTVTVEGGTYTQDGIQKGATLLTNATDITYQIEGDETTYTRAPVIILLTDGEPTVGNTNPDLSGTVDGNGGYYSSDRGVYTMKSAAYYKEQISNHYYPNGKGKAQFYTIGYDISSSNLHIKTILNPTNENVTACGQEDSGSWPRALYNKLLTSDNDNNNRQYNGKFTYNNTSYNFSYADKSYIGEMDEDDLDTVLADIVSSIKHYVPVVSHTTNINRDPALAELIYIDIEHKVTIKIDGTATEKTVEEWRADNIIIKQGDKYYVDLLAGNLKTAKLIDITYYEIEGSTVLNSTTRVFSSHAPLSEEEMKDIHDTEDVKDEDKKSATGESTVPTKRSVENTVNSRAELDNKQEEDINKDKSEAEVGDNKTTENDAKNVDKGQKAEDNNDKEVEKTDKENVNTDTERNMSVQNEEKSEIEITENVQNTENTQNVENIQNVDSE